MRGPRAAGFLVITTCGFLVIATYGMSETCGGCVYDGLPLDGVGVAVGVDGRIRVAGPALFSGYLGRPDLTRRGPAQRLVHDQ